MFLVLIDLSAAFDTVSHQHLSSILSSQFLLGGSVLKWIESYLTGRSFHAKVADSLSDSVSCDVVVTQGSVLGSVPFNCIMLALPTLLSNLGIGSHVYADDTQFLVSFCYDAESIENEVAACGLIAKALSDIESFI